MLFSISWATLSRKLPKMDLEDVLLMVNQIDIKDCLKQEVDIEDIELVLQIDQTLNHSYKELKNEINLGITFNYALGKLNESQLLRLINQVPPHSKRGEFFEKAVRGYSLEIRNCQPVDRTDLLSHSIKLHYLIGKINQGAELAVDLSKSQLGKARMCYFEVSQVLACQADRRSLEILKVMIFNWQKIDDRLITSFEKHSNTIQIAQMGPTVDKRKLQKITELMPRSKRIDLVKHSSCTTELTLDEVQSLRMIGEELIKNKDRLNKFNRDIEFKERVLLEHSEDFS